MKCDGLCLNVRLCLLFNALLRHGIVPSDFCSGIIIPLLKGKHGDASSLDMYRDNLVLRSLSYFVSSRALAVSSVLTMAFLLQCQSVSLKLLSWTRSLARLYSLFV